MKKSRRTYTHEVEQGEWYGEKPLFYNKGFKEFEDTGEKNRLYEEKARSLKGTGMFILIFSFFKFIYCS